MQANLEWHVSGAVFLVECGHLLVMAVRRSSVTRHVDNQHRDAPVSGHRDVVLISNIHGRKVVDRLSANDGQAQAEQKGFHGHGSLSTTTRLSLFCSSIVLAWDSTPVQSG